MWILLATVACGGPAAEGLPSDGGAVGADGGADTGADTAEPCMYLPAGDRLQLQVGCADGLCGGTTWPEAQALMGEPDTCFPTGSLQVQCDWQDLSVSFPDCDQDGLPDAKVLCDWTQQSVFVHGRWDGSSPEGLGLGITAECWIEALGPQVTNHTWVYGEDPGVTVTIEPRTGPVEAVLLAWQELP